MSHQLETIATFGDSVLANFARDRLTANGIRAFLADEAAVNVITPLVNAMGGIKLQVASDDVEKALSLLEDHAPTDLDQDVEDDDENDEMEADEADVPAPGPRERDADRALRATIVGLLFPPLLPYGALLIFKVIASNQPLSARGRRRAWIAALVNFPSLLAAAAIAQSIALSLLGL